MRRGFYWRSISLISGSALREISPEQRRHSKPRGRDIKWLSPLGRWNESLHQGGRGGGSRGIPLKCTPPILNN